jgi:hypothetical protein
MSTPNGTLPAGERRHMPIHHGAKVLSGRLNTWGHACDTIEQCQQLGSRTQKKNENKSMDVKAEAADLF